MKDFTQIRENSTKKMLAQVSTAVTKIEDAQIALSKAMKMSAAGNKDAAKALKGDMKKLDDMLMGLQQLEQMLDEEQK